MKLKKLKLNKRIIPVILMLFVLGTLLLLNFTNTQIIKDNEELEPGTELIYYINVTYDGRDKNAINSSDSNISGVYSGNIYVEDFLPSDLTFKNFLITEEGSIGAVERGTGNGCLGQVIDDSKTVPSSSSFVNTRGLHFDKSSRKVSFTVKGLQAGCQLTVGVVTETPETVDDKSTEDIEVRRDIYNTVTAKDGKQVVTSNTVHGWMGISEEFITLYNVKYEYDKEYPSAPNLPEVRKYAPNATVSLATNPTIDGYVFNGWQTKEATLINGTFKMPEKNVTLVGSFEKIQTYNVTYEIDGDMPEGYEVPRVKSYYVGDNVKIDSTSSGFIYKGYKFLGWTTDDVELNSDGRFEMPEKDIVIKGKFEKIKYKVSFQFTSSVKPENADSYLPTEKEYAIGETVKLSNIDDVEGYEFMGWLYDYEFKMPEHDVVINGEWKRVTGTFKPSLSMRNVTGRDYYRTGERVRYEITVTNNEAYPIKEVQVKQNNSLQFLNGEGYTLRNDSVVIIPTINAGSSVTISAVYIVAKDVVGSVTNEVQLISALADNNYLFDDTASIKAKASVSIMSSLRICNEIENGSGQENFGLHVTGNGYDSWMSFSKSGCKTIYLDPGRYVINEVIPQEFSLTNVEMTRSGSTSKLDVNNPVVNISTGENVSVTFKNSYKKKGFYHSVKWLFSKIRGSINE